MEYGPNEYINVCDINKNTGVHPPKATTMHHEATSGGSGVTRPLFRPLAPHPPRTIFPVPHGDYFGQHSFDLNAMVMNAGSY